MNVPAGCDIDERAFLELGLGRVGREGAEFIKADSSSGERWYVLDMKRRCEKVYGSP